LYTHELLWELGVNVDNDSIHGDWYAPSLIDTPIGYNVTQ
jgi:hypothetical protein